MCCVLSYHTVMVTKKQVSYIKGPILPPYLKKSLPTSLL